MFHKIFKSYTQLKLSSNSTSEFSTQTNFVQSNNLEKVLWFPIPPPKIFPCSKSRQDIQGKSDNKKGSNIIMTRIFIPQDSKLCLHHIFHQWPIPVRVQMDSYIMVERKKKSRKKVFIKLDKEQKLIGGQTLVTTMQSLHLNVLQIYSLSKLLIVN